MKANKDIKDPIQKGKKRIVNMELERKLTSIINEGSQTTAVHTSLHCRKARTEG